MSEFILHRRFELIFRNSHATFHSSSSYCSFIHLRFFLHSTVKASGIAIISSITAENVKHPKPKTYSVCNSKHPSQLVVRSKPEQSLLVVFSRTRAYFRNVCDFLIKVFNRYFGEQKGKVTKKN